MADDDEHAAAADARGAPARSTPLPPAHDDDDDDAYALAPGEGEDDDDRGAAADQEAPFLPELTTAQGRIDRLEVRDFKSYRGEHVIGPFRAFTAVVGPNGSGKSNLMDAISFVLGVRTAQLRGSLKELLYAYTEPTGGAGGGAGGGNKGKGAANAANAATDRPQAARSASVTLVYDDGQGGEVRFMRAIVPAGKRAAAAGGDDDEDDDNAPPTTTADDATNYQSQYRIDGQRVTWDAYARRLSSFGILVKVRNFLVFQGDIERVATLPPEGLSALVEQVSGSEEFARPYNEAEQSKSRADERAALAFQKRKAVGAERKQKKEQRDEAERHLKLERDLSEARTYWRLWQLYHLREDMRAAREAMASARSALDRARQEHGAHEGEVESRRRALAALVRERLALEKRAAKAAADRAKKAPALARAQEEGARLERRVEAGKRELEAARTRRDEQGERLRRLEAELARVLEERQQLDQQPQEAGGNGGGGRGGRSRSRTGGGAGPSTTAEGLPAMDEAQLQEYRRLREEVGVRTSLLEGERDTLRAEQRADEEALLQQRQAAAQLRARAEERRAAAATADERAAAARDESLEAKRAAKAKRAERAALETDAMAAAARRERCAQRLAELERRLSDARAERRQSERDRRIAEAAAMLKREVPGVHGRLTDLSRVTARKYGLALAVALGHNLDAVVVDSRAVAFACIDQLVSRRLERMEFIPLDSCDARPADEALRGALPPGSRLAIDLLEFEPHLGRAFQYALG
jgi:structural maintenance of chromosome 1